MSPKLCRKITIATTGSIGIVDTLKFIMHLRHHKFTELIKVIMSESAQRLVTSAAMRAYGGSEVLTDLFDPEGYPVPHLDTNDPSDLFLVMPATANILGKVAHGIADDLVSTCIMANDAPVVFVPSMNDRMWRNYFVVRNVELLRAAGYIIIEPVMGIEVSTMATAFGAMPAFDSILEELFRVVGKLR